MSTFATAFRPTEITSKNRVAIGDPVDVLIEGLYRQLVGYVMVDIRHDENSPLERVPIGTFFFVSREVGGSWGAIHYAVTCRHVVENLDKHGQQSFLRFNDQSGVPRDLLIRAQDWELSARSDIAVAIANFPIRSWAYPTERIAPFGLFDGQQVFTIGMFASNSGLVNVQPIVRTGTIAHLNATVPMPLVGGDLSIEAHLIEAWTWGGMSGSPVFVYDERDKSPKMAFDPGYGPGFEMRPALLGVLCGSYPINVEVDGKCVDVNSGIGIVAPFSEINKLLNLDRFKKHREQILATPKRQKPATPC
jgi:hypothetical protein